MPHGPTRFGPMRCCIRPTTLRSNTIVNSVMRTRNTKTPTTLISTIQTGSSPKPGRRSATRSSPRRQRHRSDAGASPATVDDRDAAPAGAEARPHRAAARVGRQPDHAVGHVGDHDRQGDRAAGRWSTRTASPSADAERGGRGRATQRPGRLGGAGQVLVAVLQPAGVEQLGQVASTASPGRRRGRAGRRRTAGAADAAGAGAEPASSARAAATVGSPRATSSSSASASSTRASVSAPVPVRAGRTGGGGPPSRRSGRPSRRPRPPGARRRRAR